MLEFADVLSIINWLMWAFVFKHVLSATLNFAAEQLHFKLSLDKQLLADKQCVCRVWKMQRSRNCVST